MFLRSCQFDVKFAALRMVGYFEKKAELFGVDKLAKDITLGDLEEPDRKALEAGGVQVLPSRDRAGRLVTFFSPALLKRHNVESRVRRKHTGNERSLVYFACATNSFFLVVRGFPVPSFCLGFFLSQSYDVFGM